MTSGPGLPRLASWVRREAAGLRQTSQPLLLRALQEASRPRTVGVFEYQMRPKARYGWGSPAHPRLLDLLAGREGEAEATVEAVTAGSEDLARIPGGRDPDGALTWDNDWWNGIDAMVQYCAIRDRRPRTYIEVGSGYSTRFARRAVSDHGLATRIVSIDPHPRAEIDDLCDSVIRCSLEEADLSVFDVLGPGDLVLVDGSHTAFMNSDAVVAFLEVLPRLPEGVLVGIDDVFLPWDYPESWAGRWYGEQYLLAAMLLAGAPGWALRFPAWYLTQESGSRRRFDRVWDHVAPAAGRYAMSFWMERTAGPEY